MSWPLIISLICAGFALGAALRLLRSPNSDPFENLARDGKMLSTTLSEIESSGDWFNVVIHYEVSGVPYTRTLPWPAAREKPSAGASVEIRYLPESPGLSRIV